MPELAKVPSTRKKFSSVNRLLVRTWSRLYSSSFIVCLVGDLLLSFRIIKGERATFKVEGTAIITLFTIGQIALYLLLGVVRYAT